MRRRNSKDIVSDKFSRFLDFWKIPTALFSWFTNFENFCGNQLSQINIFRGQKKNLFSLIWQKFLCRFLPSRYTVNLCLRCTHILSSGMLDNAWFIKTLSHAVTLLLGYQTVVRVGCGRSHLWFKHYLLLKANLL